MFFLCIFFRQPHKDYSYCKNKAYLQIIECLCDEDVEFKAGGYDVICVYRTWTFLEEA